MALNFPSNPTNGQVYTSDGKSWVYNSTTTSWQLRSTTSYLPLTGGTLSGLLQVNSDVYTNGLLRIQNSQKTSYVEFRNTLLSGNFTYNFPNGYGTNNQVLTTNGSGGLSWTSVVNSITAGSGISISSSSGTVTVSVINPFATTGFNNPL